MASTLQELRKEAGYKTAKDLAEAMGIPAPTYARYEQNPEKIPIKPAWSIADFLGCTIDAVVGREPVDINQMRGEVQKTYDALSAKNRELLDEFISFVASKDEKEASARRAIDDMRLEQLEQYYERLLDQKAEEEDACAERVIFGSYAQRRATFQDFISRKTREKGERELRDMCDDLASRAAKGGGYIQLEDGSEFFFTPGESGDEEKERLHEALTKLNAEKDEQREKEVVEKMMAFYDRRHEHMKPRIEYAVVEF